MDFAEITRQFASLPRASFDEIAKAATLTTLPKGHLVIEAGKVERDIYFLARGIVRAYYESDDGRQVTFWIGSEGDVIMSLHSYTLGQPGYETIQLLEDCTLYRLRQADLQGLYDRDLNIANWGRKLAEIEFMKAEKRMIPLLCTTASQRYRQLLHDHPQLLRRVPLECLASYLGVTPVSLSRIRAKIK